MLLPRKGGKVMAQEKEISKLRASLDKAVQSAEVLRIKELPEEGQNKYIDLILAATTTNGVSLSIAFAITLAVIGKRAEKYLWGKIPYSERLAEYKKIEKEAESATDLREYLDLFRETLLGDSPPMITKQKESGTIKTATESQRVSMAYAVEIMKIDHQTGEVRCWTDRRRYKTRIGADRAAARWSSICRPNGRTAVSETIGRVVAAR
jgi:hypothetical protein